MDKDINTIMNQLIGPIEKVTALAEDIVNYGHAVKKGSLITPAYKRDASPDDLASIWRDTRLEAMTILFQYGNGTTNAAALADPRQQLQLLESFAKDKPHLEHPHKPNETITHDTWQAVFKIYLHLDNISKQLGDLIATQGMHKNNQSLTSILKDIERREKQTIFHEFEDLIIALHQQWQGFWQHGNDIPKTIFEILYEDVTAKCKVIMLGAVFGPYYMDGIKTMKSHLSDRLKQDGYSDKDISIASKAYDTKINSILNAKDCDELVKTK